MGNEIILSPTQQAAADGVIRALRNTHTVLLRTRPGMGRTTILESVRAQTGGVLIGAREFSRALILRRPETLEAAVFELLEGALEKHETVILDDLHLLMKVVDGFNYPHAYLFDVALTAIIDGIASRGKRLVFGTDPENTPWVVQTRGRLTELAAFTEEDFVFFASRFLPEEKVPTLNCAQLHRFAPGLNVRQLKNACEWLNQEEEAGTEEVLEHLREQDLASNVDLQEVPEVDWKDLSGVDDVIRALEAKVALPFEDDKLAVELKLKPKRGVLLAGPPGTGKTTVGRALARRLRSKFFLIDGTVIAGSGDFYDSVNSVFAAAKKNAPAVVFIDDADVIFEGGDGGFYRYLLTMLDGLESASAERVCVMMTAMNVSSLPPAILRSGRIELWLEMQLPDEAARSEIFRRRLNGLPQPVGGADVSTLACASRGLTGADLKAVIEDGKLLFAHDKARGIETRAAEDYFLEAIETVRANRRSYNKPQADPFRDVKIGFVA